MLDYDSIKQGHKHEAMGTQREEKAILTGRIKTYRGLCRDCEI